MAQAVAFKDKLIQSKQKAVSTDGFFCHNSASSRIRFNNPLGFDDMRGDVGDRAILLAQYIIETGATVRATAKVFKISKSTVHKDVAQRLKRIDARLYSQAKQVLETNKAQRHIRGGLATRRKYEEMR